MNQTLIYMHCDEAARQKRAALPAANAIDPFLLEPIAGYIILYENKDTQELREFPVPYDAAQIAAFMADRRRLMDKALSYERDGTWPDCRCHPSYPSPLCTHFEHL